MNEVPREDGYARIAVLEEQMRTLIDKTEERDKKIDQLLDLKNRGVGAFWLASLIMGSGTVTLMLTFIDWLRGTH